VPLLMVVCALVGGLAAVRTIRTAERGDLEALPFRHRRE
jgi:hypothetical protein